MKTETNKPSATESRGTRLSHEQICDWIYANWYDCHAVKIVNGDVMIKHRADAGDVSLNWVLAGTVGDIRNIIEQRKGGAS